MSETSDDLNLKMLERAAEDFEGRRRDFFRDLKIAVALLLAFQFFIFFRFIQLSDEKLQLDAELGRTQTNYAAVTNINARVSVIGDDFERAANRLLQELDRVPENLRARIKALEEDIVAFRKLPDPLAAPAVATGASSRPIANAAFSPIQASPEAANAPLTARAPSPTLQLPPTASNMAFQGDPAARTSDRSGRSWPQFSGLGTNELKTLHSAPTDDPTFQSIVNRLVVEQIIQPNFELLNQRWRSGLVDAFVAARAALLVRSNDWTQLERTGFPREQVATNLASVEQTLRNHRFQPPASTNWWTTYGGKLEQSREMHLDAQRTTAGLTDALALSRRKVAAFKNDLDALLEKTEALQKATQDELLQVQTNASSLQSLLQTYVTPIPFIPIGPREAVIYFPVIVAAAYLFFAVRHVRLRSRASELSSAYAALGVSRRVRDLIFSTPQLPARYRLLVGCFVVAPVALTAVSAQQLLRNQALQKDAPQLLFLLAGLLLVGSCVFLIRTLFDRAEAPAAGEGDLQPPAHRG